jgi:hypothetical protein
MTMVVNEAAPRLFLKGEKAMKHLKILVPAIFVVAGLMAFAGHASATTLTSPTGTVYTGPVEFQSEGHSVTHNPIAVIECNSTFRFNVETHGSGVTAGGAVNHMVTGPCTNEWHVTVVSAGTMKVHWTSGYNGTLTSSGITVEKTRFGISCRYATNNTTIGTVTGGSPATADISGTMPFHNGSLFCGSGGTGMTGSYKLVTPTSLYVDP